MVSFGPKILLIASSWVSSLPLAQEEIAIESPDALLPNHLSQAGAFAELQTYNGALSITHHQQFWRSFGQTPYDSIIVLGSGLLRDNADAICIGAYLNSHRLFYGTSIADVTDITIIRSRIRQDFQNKTVVCRNIDTATAENFYRTVNARYLDSVTQNHYLIPLGQNKQAEALDHFQINVGLAQDLIMRVPEISGDAWWCLRQTDEGELVDSIDHNLAFANFISRIPDIQSVLDVGCGSGFLALHLAAQGIEQVVGVDPVENRIEGAKLLRDLSGLSCDFAVMGAEALHFPDKSFDVVVTSYALEQCQEIIEGAIAELLRVARKYVILVEPSAEFFPTLAGIIHITEKGYPSNYSQLLTRHQKPFSARIPLLRNYYNPGCLYFANVHSDIQPHLLFPHLFHPDLLSTMMVKQPADWISSDGYDRAKLSGLLKYSQPTPDPSSSEQPESSPPPSLVKEFGQYNIVSWQGLFYGLPKALGPIDLTTADQPESMKGVFVNATLSDLEETILNYLVSPLKLEQCRTDLRRSRKKVRQLKQAVQEMEGSKFWQLRRVYLKLKGLFKQSV